MSSLTISQIMGKDSYTVPELKMECKKRGITGYSKLKKKELVDKIMENSNTEIKNKDRIEETKGEVIKEEMVERKATLHYDINFKYRGLSIKEIKIISKYEKNGNQKQIEKVLEDEINSNNKYKIGDIVTTVYWIISNEEEQPSTDCCYGIICKDGDRKQIIPLFDSMTSTRFINEHSYLKNINYDDVMINIKKNDCVEAYESPISLLSLFYSKLNDKTEMYDKLQALWDNGEPYAVLSNLDVLEVDF